MAAAASATGVRGFRHPLPLALYVHIPWCMRKCPYCDFNSHATEGPLPWADYLAALLRDLDLELAHQPVMAPLTALFIGGGTPSLLPGEAIAGLLAGVGARGLLAPDTEVTLEANPGAADAGRFAAYRAAGVNRLSIGVQSFNDSALQRIGRIHDAAAARFAVTMARAAGFENLNLDLMYGLPGQTPAAAVADLEAALALEPAHLSWYELTLEPNTAFHADPPELPGGDVLADIEDAGQAQLAAAGFGRYEVSAWATPGRRCRHNLNYWQFGDYIGIGAGAYGKRSDVATGRVERRTRLRAPTAYLAAPDPVSGARLLTDADLRLEFALNACRLVEGFTLALFEAHTGLSRAVLAAPIAAAVRDGLLEPRDLRTPDRVRPTALGLRFANVLIGRLGEGAAAESLDAQH